MIITEELLTTLGWLKTSDGYRLLTGPVKFFLWPPRKSGDYWTFGVLNDDRSNTHHCVTHIDELLSFAYDMGFEDGKKAKVQELKDVLEV